MTTDKEIFIHITQTGKIHKEEVKAYENDSVKTIITKDYKNNTQTRTDILKCKCITLDELRIDNTNELNESD